MRTLILALLAAVLLAAPAAAQLPQDDPDPSIEDGSAQAALTAAKDRWAATGLRSYRFRVAVTCFCPASFRRPATVTVRRGRPVHPPARVRAIATVPRLFAKVQAAIDQRVARLDVAYGRRGVPRSIAIDVSRMIADEERGYTARHLKPLEP